MQMSAKIIGREYGLTGEEMNRVLEKLGFLVGEAGDYSPTEKALPFAVEKYNHSGCGGYSWYNPSWTTRTFDDSIKEVLDVTPSLISEVRAELSATRAARRAEYLIEQAAADAAFLAKRAAEEAAKEAAKEAAEKAAADSCRRIVILKKAGIICIVVLGSAAVVYAIYKAVPYVKRWWDNRKDPENDDSICEEEHIEK